MEPFSAKTREPGETLIAAATLVLLAWLGFEAGFDPTFVLDDNRVEYAQVLVLLVAVVVFARRAWRATPSWRPLLGLLAVAAGVLLLEEISWGQRLIGFETPDILARHNVQGESNLHNVHPGTLLLPAFVVLAAAAAGLATRRALTLRSGLVVVPRVSAAKWMVVIVATLSMVLLMPWLGSAAGIEPEDIKKVFAFESLWREDRALLSDPQTWRRIGLDAVDARNLIFVYRVSETTEMLVYWFVLRVALQAPRRW